ERNFLTRLLRQRLDQFRDIRNAKASHHVIAGPGIVGAVAALGDIAEAASSDQGVDQRVEERKWLLLCLDASLVDQSAEAGPNGCAPARSADLQNLVVKYEESALVGICGKAHVWDKAVVARRDTPALLPR